jgi:hypothetical protein
MAHQIFKLNLLEITNRLLKKPERSTFSVAEVIHVITLLGCAENSKNKRACFV